MAVQKKNSVRVSAGAVGAAGGRAVVYVRISDDPSGLERGVDRQEQDCRELAESLGLGVVEVFRENDTSAFKQKTITLPSGERVRRVIRPGFRAMLAFLARGGGDVMVAYDLDRAVRDPRDLEDLIDARVLHGFTVRSVTGSLRLDTDSDVAMARVMVAMANKSSADTARRVARACRQQAVEGRWHGGMPPFGYRAEGTTLYPIPEQAELVREAAERIIAGESLYSVRCDWNKRGVATIWGAPWSEKAVKQLMRNPAMKGVRVYHPIQPDGSVAKTAEVVTPGNWPAIMDDQMWDKVNLVLDERRARYAAMSVPIKRVYPFSGLIRCADCGTPMRKQSNRYVCLPPQPGACSRSINFAEISALVEQAVLSVFAQIAVDPAMGPKPRQGGSVEADELAGLIEVDKQALSQLDDDRYDGLIDKPTWARQRSRLTDRIAVHQKRWQAVLPPTVVSAAVDVSSVAAEWPGRPAQWQHDAAALVLESVLVGPHPVGVASTLCRRLGETDDGFSARVKAHRQELLARRVELVWKA